MHEHKFMLELKAVTGKLAAPPEGTRVCRTVLAVCFLKWGRYLPTLRGAGCFHPREEPLLSIFSG